MRAAASDELREEAVPLLRFRAPEPRVRKLFPIPLLTAQEWSEAEPSVGALIRLDSRDDIVLTYGLVTNRGLVLAAKTSDRVLTLIALLSEVPIRREEIDWTADEKALAQALQAIAVAP